MSVLKTSQKRSQIGPYSVVPEWIALSASPQGLKLWCILSRFSNYEDCAWPSQETLAEILDWSVDTVQRAVKNLIEIEAIEVETISFGMKRNNLYFLKPSIPCKPQKCGLHSRKSAVSATPQKCGINESQERTRVRNETDAHDPASVQVLVRETLGRLK